MDGTSMGTLDVRWKSYAKINHKFGDFRILCFKTITSVIQNY